MPLTHPIAASGSREAKKPATVPKEVRAAMVIMVRGKPGDQDMRPQSFIEAANLCGVDLGRMRRWLDRPEGRAFLLAERRSFRNVVCASNELALQRVRDTSENGMAVIGSVRALEDIDEEAKAPGRGGIQQFPGFVIVVQNGPGATPTVITPGEARTGITIDHQADDAPLDG